MLSLITGGSGSGKSAYAERLVQEGGGSRRYYLATMAPSGEEARERIARHRAMRADKGFETIEVYEHLERVILPGKAKNTVVLLECMSNLVANEQFGVGGEDVDIVRRVLAGIAHLQSCAGNLFIVTNEVFSDGNIYDRESMRYLDILGKINRELSKTADRVIEVVYGIPLELK